MRKFNRLVKFALLTAQCCACLAGGGSAAAAADRGFYLSAGAGLASFDSGSSYSYTDFVRSYSGTRTWRDDSSPAWSVATGYRFVPWLATELSYEDFGSGTFTDTHLDANRFGGRIDRTILGETSVNGFTTSIIGNAVHKAWEVSARVGVIRAKVESNGSTTEVISPVPGMGNPPSLPPTFSDFRNSVQSTNILFGLGMGYTFIHRLHVRGDWRLAKELGNEDGDQFSGVDVSTLALSFQYRF